MTLKNCQGYRKWYEQVKMSNYFIVLASKFTFADIYSVEENLSVKVFATPSQKNSITVFLHMSWKA